MGSSVLVIKQRSSLSLSPHLHQVLTQFSEPLSVINLIMFSLKALAVVLTVVCLTEAHSPQKRETTVSNFSPRSATARTVAGIDLTAVLGIVFAFILLDILFTLLLVGGSVAGKRSSQTGLFNWGLPDFSNVYSSVSQMYNSIDLVDMAFNYMDIEDETCRMKTICQAENYAVNHPVGRLAINTLNSSLRGMEKTAVSSTTNAHSPTLDWSTRTIKIVKYCIYL